MEKPSENNRRERLFNYLDDAIILSHGKLMAARGNSDKAKQGWMNRMVQAIGVYGNLLKDVELERLASDIEMIKEKIGLKTE